jgi:hypothetical protein
MAVKKAAEAVDALPLIDPSLLPNATFQSLGL